MTRLNIRVQPRASQNEVSGFSADGTLRVRVTAPPSEGQANEAVVKVLAEALCVGRSSVRIVQGATSRSKVVEIDGLDGDEIRRRVGSGSAGRVHKGGRNQE